MREHGSRENDRIHFRVGKQVVDTGCRLRGGIAPAAALEPGLVAVTNPADLDAVDLHERPKQRRPPVAESHDSDVERLVAHSDSATTGTSEGMNAWSPP